MTRFMALVLGALLLAGCAETQRLMAKAPDAEAFLTRAAEAYGTSAPSLMVESATPNGWTAYVRASDGWRIHLDMKALGRPEWQVKKILAHEFAHLHLHNYGITTAGLGPAVENETDAKAVEVLMKADHLTEREAFKVVYDYSGGQRVLLGALPVWSGAQGHGSPCEAIDFLLGRYPAQTSWAKRCGEVKPGPPKAPEEIAKIKADFDACRADSGYTGAKLTVNQDGRFFWNGNDPDANEKLKDCLRAHGRRVN